MRIRNQTIARFKIYLDSLVDLDTLLTLFSLCTAEDITHIQELWCPLSIN